MTLTHETTGRRIRFGAGAIACVPEEVELLDCRRVLVVAGHAQAEYAERLLRALGGAGIARIVGVRMHVPLPLAVRAREMTRAVRADCLVALGGGSAVGLAKAIAVTERLPIVAVPTTYAGSELTSTWGITESGRKTTSRDPRVVPRAVVYDPELTYSLPPAITAASGMNAVAHCVEALWGPAATPVTDALAGEGIRLLAAGLPVSVESPRHPEARAQALTGAWLAGEAFSAGSALHHKLCHVLGGAFDLPHAELHAALLPYTTAYLLPAAPAAERRIADALGADDAVLALSKLARSLGVPASLGELGLTVEQAGEAAELAAPELPDRPRRPTLDELRRLLTAATVGEPVPVP